MIYSSIMPYCILSSILQWNTLDYLTNFHLEHEKVSCISYDINKVKDNKLRETAATGAVSLKTQQIVSEVKGKISRIQQNRREIMLPSFEICGSVSFSLE